MTTRQEMLEYVEFKLDDEGLEGIAEHCQDYIYELWPDHPGELAERISIWRSQAMELEHWLREALQKERA